jgi:CBS domain-containing protein
MQRDFVTAEAQLPLAQLIRQHLLVSGYVLLTDGQQVVGVLDLADIKKVPSNTWWQIPASDVMTPLGQMIMVKPDSTALHASNLMQAGQSRRVFILAESTGKLNPEILGVLGQEHLHRVARGRMK